MKRTIVIRDACRLSLEDCQLTIVGDGLSETVPVDDIGTLIVENMQTVLTCQIINALSSSGVCTVVCDDTHMPSTLVLPMEGHSRQGAIVRKQLANAEGYDRIWEQIVRHKLRNQKAVLKNCGRTVNGFGKFIEAGDASSAEVAAASVYFKALFGSRFVRNPHAGGVNALLNYGYTILRSLVARCIVASGLYYGTGIHHHSEYDAWPLVDDLIEPLRPAVDAAVYELFRGQNTEVNTMSRQRLMDVLSSDIYFGRIRHQLSDACAIYVTSAATAICGDSDVVIFPSVDES